MAITYLEQLTGYTVLDRPLPWQTQGTQETASGYGKRLRSRFCVRTDDGILRRVYVTQYSNVGTVWVYYHGREYVCLRTAVLQDGDRVERDPD